MAIGIERIWNPPIQYENQLILVDRSTGVVNRELRILRDRGWNIHTVASILSNRAADSDIEAYAKEHGGFVITADKRGFVDPKISVVISQGPGEGPGDCWDIEKDVLLRMFVL